MRPSRQGVVPGGYPDLSAALEHATCAARCDGSLAAFAPLGRLTLLYSRSWTFHRHARKNEAENIEPLVGEIRAALDGLCAYEIVYVDDGSTDANRRRILRLTPQAPQLRLLRHAQSCGQSAAIRTGVRAARQTGSRRSTATAKTIRPTFRNCGILPARRRRLRRYWSPAIVEFGGTAGRSERRRG